jgi:hypothetical protein
VDESGPGRPSFVRDPVRVVIAGDHLGLTDDQLTPELAARALDEVRSRHGAAIIELDDDLRRAMEYLYIREIDLFWKILRWIVEDTTSVSGVLLTSLPRLRRLLEVALETDYSPAAASIIISITRTFGR